MIHNPYKYHQPDLKCPKQHAIHIVKKKDVAKENQEVLFLELDELQNSPYGCGRNKFNLSQQLYTPENAVYSTRKYYPRNTHRTQTDCQLVQCLLAVPKEKILIKVKISVDRNSYQRIAF